MDKKKGIVCIVCGGKTPIMVFYPSKGAWVCESCDDRYGLNYSKDVFWDEKTKES